MVVNVLVLFFFFFCLFFRSKRTDFGPHDWHSMPVSGAQTWLVVPGLEPGTEYQFSVLAQNKLGTGPFSEVVTVNTAGGSPVGAFFNLPSPLNCPFVLFFLDIFFCRSSCAPPLLWMHCLTVSPGLYFHAS